MTLYTSGLAAALAFVVTVVTVSPFTSAVVTGLIAGLVGLTVMAVVEYSNLPTTFGLVSLEDGGDSA